MENEYENQLPMEEQPSEQTVETESQPEQTGEGASYQQLPRFSSEPTTGGWNYPYAEQGNAKPPKVKKQRKKGKTGKIILCVIAVILLLCLSVGGGYVGANLQNWISGPSAGDNSLQPDKNENTGSNADVLEGNREDTTVNIQQVSTGELMTAAQVYAKYVNATVGITTSVTTNYWGFPTTSAASGSGFVYSKDGYIVTNYHVVSDADSITVSFYNGETMEAALIGYDESNDVAVLKVEADDLTPVVIGDSTNLNVGDPVVAIGNPLGELTFSLTSGVVSALSRQVTFSDGLVMSLIQTDCAINSGNSGGALFNLYGEVIGITNAKYSGNSGSGATIDNIGFAIPISHARNIVDSIIKTGYVAQPYIGVTIEDVSQELQGYGIPKGAVVKSVVKDSPAEAGGLRAYDVVTEINGKPVSGSSDLKMIVTESKPGDVLKLKVWRVTQTLDLEIVVGEKIQGSTQQQESTESILPFPFN